MGSASLPASTAWESLATSLGLAGATKGQSVDAPAGAPPLTGVAEHTEDQQVLLRLKQPAAGVAHLFALPLGEQVLLSIRFYFYGETAAAAVRENEPIWQSWITEHYPMAGPVSTC